MLRSDRAPIEPARTTSAGYMIASCRVARANNVAVYRSEELGRPPGSTLRLYRPEGVLFSGDSMQGWAFKPIVLDHPPTGGVDSTSWRRFAVGFVDGSVARDGDYLRLNLMVADAGAQAAIRAGARQLSAGCRCEVDFTPGTSPRGEAYDCAARSIVADHVACVTAGRAGSECAIPLGDTQTTGATDMGTVELSDQQRFLNDAAQRLGDTVAGLPFADGVAVITDALRTASIRADERRRRGPGTPYGSYLETLRTAHQQRG